MNERLKALKADETTRLRYLHAIRELQACGVDIILMEMNLPGPIQAKSVQDVSEVAKHEWFESIGWENCRHTVFNLLEIQKDSDGQE